MVIQEDIKRWLEKNAMIPEAQFVYRAWLKARGDKVIVQVSIERWLAKHATIPEANFVYRAWLEATRDVNAIRDYVIAWLKVNANVDDLDFLLRAWLGAGGDFDSIRKTTLHWVEKHCLEKHATFLIKEVAKQRNLPVSAVRAMLAWCRTFPADEDALWRFTQLSANLRNPEVATNVLQTAELLIRPILECSTTRPVTAGQLNHVFSLLLTGSSFKGGEFGVRLDSLFVMWIRHPTSYSIVQKPYKSAQVESFVIRLGLLIKAGLLDIQRDTVSLRKVVLWLNTWEDERKVKIMKQMTYLERSFPAPEIWGLFVPPPRPSQESGDISTT
ncbi:MAG: hypothetical protein ACYDBB_26960 [Armatimonadota bacterium]